MCALGQKLTCQQVVELGRLVPTRDIVGGARAPHPSADFGGFGVGSDFSWQVVGTYGFDTTCLGTPFHAVIGYRALSVDFSEEGKFGKNGLDFVQHGPIMGVTFHW